MANPRGQLLVRCDSMRPAVLRSVLIPIPIGFALVVVVGGLLTGYWAAFIFGTAIFLLAVFGMFFLFTFRPVAVYENGIEAGSFRRWNEVASIHLWEYGMVSVMHRRTMGVWGKFEEAVEFQVPPECVDDLHAALVRAYPGTLQRFETGPL